MSRLTIYFDKSIGIDDEELTFLNKKKEIGSTDVDLDSYMELRFENNFISKVSASFTKNLGKKSKIIRRISCET